MLRHNQTLIYYSNRGPISKYYTYIHYYLTLPQVSSQDTASVSGCGWMAKAMDCTVASTWSSLSWKEAPREEEEVCVRVRTCLCARVYVCVCVCVCQYASGKCTEVMFEGDFRERQYDSDDQMSASPDIQTHRYHYPPTQIPSHKILFE